MGWNFRKRVRVGPFNINLSKTGIGYSVGVRGFRAGQNARGQKYTQTSIPGTGIYRRDYQISTGNRNWTIAVLIILGLLLVGFILSR
jgi:Protein of unknown function (DUF4236)